MKKYQFILEERLLKQAECVIRKKEDIISLLLITIKMILLKPITKFNDVLSGKPHLTIYVNKMSRVIFVVENKIFSFQFPFIIREIEEATESKLEIFYNQVKIDSQISSLLFAILNETKIFQGDLAHLKDHVDEQLLENEWWEIDEVYSCELISHLVLFEPGYLRYDHDIEHINGHIHPEDHVDVYFSSNNSMKIGLNQKLDEDWFLDMLNITTNCKYLT